MATARYRSPSRRKRIRAGVGIPETEANSLPTVSHEHETHLPKQCDRDSGIARGINRRHGLATPAEVAAIELVDFALLDVSRIRQHDGAEIARRRCRENRAIIAKSGKASAVGRNGRYARCSG